MLIGLGSYNNVLAIWGHSRWKLTLTQIISLRAFSFVLTAILNSQEGCRCTLVPRLPFPVPRSPFPFPVLVTSSINRKHGFFGEFGRNGRLVIFQNFPNITSRRGGSWYFGEIWNITSRYLSQIPLETVLFSIQLVTAFMFLGRNIFWAVLSLTSRLGLKESVSEPRHIFPANGNPIVLLVRSCERWYCTKKRRGQYEEIFNLMSPLATNKHTKKNTHLVALKYIDGSPWPCAWHTTHCVRSVHVLSYFRKMFWRH